MKALIFEASLEFGLELSLSLFLLLRGIIIDWLLVTRQCFLLLITIDNIDSFEQYTGADWTVSGPIQKKSSMSDDSSSEVMELDETALMADPNLDQNLRRLQEEERLLLEQQTVMESGTVDDIAALEHQDALRLNQVCQAVENITHTLTVSA